MERIMQYLDDLEDLFCAVPLLLERLRRAFKLLTVTMVTIAFQGCALLLALTQPPLALAVASLLAVGMLYRAAVHSPRPELSPQTASHP